MVNVSLGISRLILVILGSVIVMCLMIWYSHWYNNKEEDEPITIQQVYNDYVYEKSECKKTFEMIGIENITPKECFIGNKVCKFDENVSMCEWWK